MRRRERRSNGLWFLRKGMEFKVEILQSLCSFFKKYPQDMIILDLDNEGNIIFVEILYRPDIGNILDEKVYMVEKGREYD